jgi:hypothetical protein
VAGRWEAGDMTKRLTIELTDERARQAAKVGERLGLTVEQVLHLALNVCLSEWREILPELEAHEEQEIEISPSIVRH